MEFEPEDEQDWIDATAVKSGGRSVIMLILTPLMVAFVIFMWSLPYLGSEPREEWTPAGLAIMAIFSLIALGMIAYTISPSHGWWGMRLVAFAIFVMYSGYLAVEFLSGKQIDPATRQSAANPYNALLGFLFFGMPCLVYAWTGFSVGSVGFVPVEEVEESEEQHPIAKGILKWSSILFVMLSLFSIAYAFWRKWFPSTGLPFR